MAKSSGIDWTIPFGNLLPAKTTIVGATMPAAEIFTSTVICCF